MTTYEAGMAVPDWPNTYGYNLFLYPISTWWTGPFDLFVEHGHRLLGAGVGMITILVLVSTWVTESRTWVKLFAVMTLFAVIAQGAIGGARVLLNADALARLHGCTGPLFFGMTACLATFVSRRWKEADTESGLFDNRIVFTAWLTTSIAYLQLVLGANLRHPGVNLSPQVFQSILFGHLVLAAVLALHVFWLALLARRHRLPWVARPTYILVVLVVLQLFLGFGHLGNEARMAGLGGCSARSEWIRRDCSEFPAGDCRHGTRRGRFVNCGHQPGFGPASYASYGEAGAGCPADEFSPGGIGMSTTSFTIEERGTATRLLAYAELAKPRILVMVLLTVAISAFAAAAGKPDLVLVVNAVIGTALVAGSGSALNQWIERLSDARMPRTADRPIPSNRLSAIEVLIAGMLSGVGGLFYLALFVGPSVAIWGAITWLIYVWAYTPLKTTDSLEYSGRRDRGRFANHDRLVGSRKQLRSGRLDIVCGCLLLAVSAFYGHRMDLPRRL